MGWFKRRQEDKQDGAQRTAQPKELPGKAEQAATSAAGPDLPASNLLQRCPSCDSPELFAATSAFTATFRLDTTRSVQRKLEVTQVHCKNCNALVNDDLRGEKKAAYARLRAGSGTQPPRTSDEVAKVLREAAQLPALSEADVREDYESVHKAWGCLGIIEVPEDKLESFLTTAIGGYFAEDAARLSAETLEQHVVLVSFITMNDSWRPFRLARTAGGSFVLYGQVPLYRYLGAVDWRMSVTQTLEKILILTGLKEEDPNFDMVGVANMICVSNNIKLAPGTQIELVLGCPGEVNKKRARAIVSTLESSRVTAGASDRMVVADIHGNRGVKYVVCLVLNSH